MKRLRRGISRREFIERGVALGLVTALPTLGAGCGGGDDEGATSPTPTPLPRGERELRTLHLDASLVAVTDLRLVAFGSTMHRAALLAHTDQTRQQFRQESPLLEGVPDESLTHYIEDVDLPSDALQSVLVTGKVSETGEDALVGAYIHVPIAVLQELGDDAAAAGRIPIPGGKVPLLDLSATDPSTFRDLLPAANTLITPLDAATWLMFHHPEIMNLNVTLGAVILEIVQNLPCQTAAASCAPFIDELAFFIAEHWPATTSGTTTFNNQQVQAWAQLVPQDKQDGTPVLDTNGNPAYRYSLTQDTIAAARNPIRQVLRVIFDDQRFEGTNWKATRGITSVEQSMGASAALLNEEETFEVEASYPAGSTRHGIHFDRFEVTDPTTRKVEVVLRNRYLRFMSVYVQYLDASGAAIPFTKGSFDTDRAQFVKRILSNDTILGIPLTGSNVSTSELELEMPQGATTARLYFGSLGVGGEAFSPEAVDGSIMTLAFNFGIPGLFLAIGIGLSASEGFTELLEDNSVAERTLSVVKEVALGEIPDLSSGIFAATSGEIGPLLLTIGDSLIKGVIAGVPQLAALIALEVATEEAIAAVPIVGTIVEIIDVAADVSTLAQSLTEVLSNPGIFTTDISLLLTSTVTIQRDPNDFEFPRTATSYQVTATYAQGVAKTLSGSIEPGRTMPIEAVFMAPSGGMVHFDVVLKTDDDWIVGTGSSSQLVNLPATAGAVSITIMERLIPLSSGTQYEHQLKLEESDGRLVWAETADPPTATVADLCDGAPNQLCRLNGITVQTRTGMAGYGFEADGMSRCGGGTGGVLHTVQNVFLGTDGAGPETAFKSLGCGTTQPAGIVYDPLGGSLNFFLQPESDAFYLRCVVLDDTTDFNPNETLAWGRFSQPLDALAVHPAGFVVGVATSTHKMEILELPPAAVDQNTSPDAIPFSVMKSGPGTRPGLMLVPVAVAVTSDGTILVLEFGNNRIQAFDTTANPVNYFQGKTSPFAPLQAEQEAVTYLDLGIERLGYMYVLSFVSDGLSPNDYRLDIYTRDGDFLTRTVGVPAARMAVDLFRNVYTLNYETIANAPAIEPSLSQWIPKTPGVD